jgi:hypothetical protein
MMEGRRMLEQLGKICVDILAATSIMDSEPEAAQYCHPTEERNQIIDGRGPQYYLGGDFSRVQQLYVRQS